MDSEKIEVRHESRTNLLALIMCARELGEANGNIRENRMKFRVTRDISGMKGDRYRFVGDWFTLLHTVQASLGVERALTRTQTIEVIPGILEIHIEMVSKDTRLRCGIETNGG